MSENATETICKSVPQNAILIATIIGSLILFLSLVLNLFVFLLIRLNSSIKSRSTKYLSYFSLELVFLTFLTVFDVINMKAGQWIFGNIVCKITAYFLESFIVFANIILLLITYDRYMLLFRYNDYKNTLKNVRINLLVACLISAIIAIPFPIIYYETVDECNNKVCVSTAYGSIYPQIAFLLETIIIYNLPIIVMLCLYYKIFRVIWEKRRERMSPMASSKNPDHSQQNVSSKNLNPVTNNFGSNLNQTGISEKANVLTVGTQSSNLVIKKKKSGFTNSLLTIILILGVFFITWTPFIISRMLRNFNINMSAYVLRATQMVWLLYLPIYPLLYTLTNKKIRKEAKDKITKILCLKRT